MQQDAETQYYVLMHYSLVVQWYTYSTSIKSINGLENFIC
jgi:hypothetical protein